MFGNNFDTGYQYGQNDKGRNKGKRLVFRPLQRMFKPDVFLPNFSARFGEYWRGYNTGYEDTARTINTQQRAGKAANTTTSTGVKKMPRAINEHIEMLSSIEDQLQDLYDMLDKLGSNYSNAVLIELASDSVPIDYKEKLEMVSDGTLQAISRLMDRIEHKDKQTLKKMIARWEQMQL